MNRLVGATPANVGASEHRVAKNPVILRVWEALLTEENESDFGLSQFFCNSSGCTLLKVEELLDGLFGATGPPNRNGAQLSPTLT